MSRRSQSRAFFCFLVRQDGRRARQQLKTVDATHPSKKKTRHGIRVAFECWDGAI